MSDAKRLERLYKGKSGTTWRAAMQLSADNPNSAANRAYYCLYQALVGELECRGVRPELIDAGSAQASQGDMRLKWTHSFIKNNAKTAGLDGRQCQVIRDAYELRSIGDYRTENVDGALLLSMFSKVKDILECLGVDIGV